EYHYVLGLLRVGRVIDAFTVISQPRQVVGLSESRRLGAAMAAHVRAGLAPANALPPTLSGVAQVAKAVVGATGTWTGHPTFRYEWRRCDLAGGACAPIAGATSGSYTPTDGDVGSSVVVALIGTNGYGSVTGVSAATAPVSA